MSFKTVLIVTGHAMPDAEIDRAVAIAGRLGAHLTVLVLGVAPPPPSSPYGIASTDIWAGEVREGEAEARARAAAVSLRLAPGGAACSVESQYVDRATVAMVAARYARYNDLTLVTPQAEGAEALQNWVTDGALFNSGRPVLLLPQTDTAFPAVRRIMIAWDASVEAAKVVRDAIGLMHGAEAVHAVLVDPVPSFEGHGPEPGADLAAYLAHHGVAVTVHRVPREGKDVASVLRRMAGELEADLIVMGGFGHSRLRERIFGGTTVSMMKEAKVPVFMAH